MRNSRVSVSVSVSVSVCVCFKCTQEGCTIAHGYEECNALAKQRIVTTLNIISEFQPILMRNPSGRVIMPNKEACVTNTWIK